jgi:starvation-inducible DNA-binding protein
MSNINTIGLDANKTGELAEKLNVLLANYQLFYINLRGFHWNIKGEKFFELHLKFEELYNDAIIKIDEIAERILTLGHTPLHSFSDYLAHASISEAKNLSDGQSTVKSVLDSLQKLLVL